LLVGVLTALAMMWLTFALPRGGMIGEAARGAISHNREDLGDFRAFCEAEATSFPKIARTLELIYPM
jgi:hypothetical protein